MKKKHRSQRNLSLAAFGVTAAGRALVFASLIALSSCSTKTNSQSGAGSASTATGFKQADANHDGKLSRDEASDYLVGEIFSSRDANHDGRMTPQEWSGGDPARATDFKKRDANHDGIVTKEEAVNYGRAHGIANDIMREADKNHDGALDQAELQAYYASREGPPN